MNGFVMLSMVCVMMAFTSCKTALVPQYVKLENVSKLRTGMDKKQVLSNLDNVYPAEILNGTGDCEVHEYLYLKPKRSILNLTGVLDRDELTSGKEKYNEENKATLVFRNGKLATVYSEGGADDMASLLSVQSGINAECENETTVTKGCMDPSSLNYNPDALEDDGSCEYCECGMIPNPDYNPLRPISDCNTRCITPEKSVTEVKEKCDECDLIEAIKGSGANVNIELKMD